MSVLFIVLLGAIAIASCAGGERGPANPEPDLARRLYYDTNQLKSMLSAFHFARYHDGSGILRRRTKARGTIDMIRLLAWYRADHYSPGGKVDSVAHVAVLYQFDGTVVLSEVPYYQFDPVRKRDTIIGKHWGIAMLTASGREGFGWEPGLAGPDAFRRRPTLDGAYLSLVHWGVSARSFDRGDTAFTATGFRHPTAGDTITVKPSLKIEVIDSGILEANWIAAFGSPPDVQRFPP
jgi:hypothetical protein